MMTPPRALTIAGSDSGGGAGIQADLKTFAALGVYGTSVITAVTAQNTLGVKAVEMLSPQIVAEQIDAVFEDIGVGAVKTGMLGTEEIIRTVAARLEAWSAPWVVVDPVMVAKSGDPLVEDEAVAAIRDVLLPIAHLVTPNLPECERLTGLPTDSGKQRRLAAEALAARGPGVLLKGGHGDGAEITDLLYADGEFHSFRHPRRTTSSTHGTGCTLSSAIAAGLAAGRGLTQAVGEAIEYLQGAIGAAFPLGAGHGPVHHFFRWHLE